MGHILCHSKMIFLNIWLSVAIDNLKRTKKFEARKWNMKLKFEHFFSVLYLNSTEQSHFESNFGASYVSFMEKVNEKRWERENN